MQLLRLLLLGSFLTLSVQADSNYWIKKNAHKALSNQDARRILEDYLGQHPELESRLLNSNHKIPGQKWSYHDQVYGNREIMVHLISMQIKAMAERRAIKSIENIFDSQYGIGSKRHKDKGTIKNPFSIWGHPIQKEILGGQGQRTTMKIYTAFRLTLKNDLIRFARNQSVHWHQQDNETKLKQILSYLASERPLKTEALRTSLEALNYDLDELLLSVLETHLLS